MSNMGYLSTLLTAQAREKAGPKNGAVSMVTVNVDPLGAVSVTADVTVQGQGHETVLSQIVADQLGPCSRRHRRRAGNGHRQGSVVDRRRHLFVPLHARHRGGGPYRRRAHARQAQGHRGEAAQRAARRHRACRRQGAQPQQPRQRAAVRPGRRHVALVAGDAAGRHGAGVARNRGLVAAGTRAARERRPHQHVADLRFRVRHVRDRDRSADLAGPGRSLHLDARRRQAAQPADRRRPDARRIRAGHRSSALRGVRLRRLRPVPAPAPSPIISSRPSPKSRPSRCCIRRRRRRSRRSVPRDLPKAIA